jgi:Leucine-rich repeat (LRR) protein
MKKFMKRLIPFLLVVLIIVSLLWYGFVFDRNLVRDILLSQARFFSTNRNQKLASWFYDTAYMHSGQDEGVAIELANQFKAEGNYTKAEYTLSNAIADGGTAELYIALSKTYVEQDKLLDAVNMLNSIQDASIKQQLDAMRPEAPTADQEPGLYTSYISVGLSSGDGTIYYTTDGQYPSTDDIPYAEPFALPSGETAVYAISVADNGLVSPLSVLKFTIGGVIEEVSFEDSAIEGSVRELLGVDADHQLFSDELWTITSFTVPEGASTLNDLAMLAYLENLTISDYRIESLQFLNSLSFLETLSMTECKFSSGELSSIASLPALKSLTMHDCSISTLSGLENAQNLEHLDLGENTIRNLEPLSALMNLKSLVLNNNALTSLSALSGLTKLEKLDVAYNSLTSIAPVAPCVNLQWLDVSHNSLSTLSAIDNLPYLTHFAANHNGLADVSMVGNCKNLIELDISNNNITDISCLSELTVLELLDFAQNQVTELPEWPDGSALRTIDGSYNKIQTVSSLKNLMELSHVYLDYNEVTDVSPLATCYKLVMVNVYGSDVTGVEKLTERDIIVNYNPNA